VKPFLNASFGLLFMLIANEERSRGPLLSQDSATMIGVLLLILGLSEAADRIARKLLK